MPNQYTGPRVRGRRAAVVAVAALALCVIPAAALADSTAAAFKTVLYAGRQFEVPASWPVFNLSAHPHTCVRFDLHAVYLGTPGPDQICPSWLVGRTEAVLIQPGPPGATRQSLQNPLLDEIIATAPGISVTATFDTGHAVVARIITSAGLAAPVVPAAPPAGMAPAATAAQHSGASHELSVSASTQIAAAGGVPMPLPLLPVAVANDVGLGFDTCAAPSSAVMQAWLRHSPYRAIGIYIGGADRACDQQNLTATWVHQQAAAGWRFIPMYAGPQAALGQLRAPVRQGTADATDAVAQAEQLGFGPGTPLYYDMEAYPATESAPTLQFLSAWTAQLHRLGYASGVYSHSDSGIADLARLYRTHRYALPDVIYDALWNGVAGAADRHDLAGEWPGARVHQFSGNVLQAFGGQELLIDQDYLDVGLSSAGGSSQAAAAVTTGGSTAVFFEGPAHHLVEQSARPGGSWTRTYLGGSLSSAPTAVAVGTGTIDVFYQGGDDRLWLRTWTGSEWLPAERLGQLGPVSQPAAVAQPNGVIDVFWRGYPGDQLQHAQYNPGSGWAGPQDLQGTLASPPYPVESEPGHVEVFWAGRDGNLWCVVRGLGGIWSGPQELGMGRLGGPPQAVPLSGGQVEVFWRGAGPGFVISALLRPAATATGPVVPGGALGTGRPWAVAAAGSEQLLYRGRYGGLRVITRSPAGQWSGSIQVPGVADLNSSPTAASGTASDPLAVFWTGAHRQLWAVFYTRATGWGRPADLGGIAA